MSAGLGDTGSDGGLPEGLREPNPIGGPPAPGERRLGLPDELNALIETFAERPVRLREVLGVLRGRAYTLLLILLALPFCTPIPLPGVSLPFGFVIALTGFRIAVRKDPWLPARLMETALPARFFTRLLSATRRLVRLLESFLKPRHSQWLEYRISQHLVGGIIGVCGLLLLLPLPIPLSNGLPAITVVLLGCAMLERDGLFLAAGVVGFALTLCFFGGLLWGGAEAMDWVRQTFGRFLSPDDM